MAAIHLFREFFSERELEKTYDQYIALSRAVGIDGINYDIFWKKKDDEIKLISRKVLEGTYRFSKYKLKLISKGRKKFPREISIPTFRDRLTLRALCNFLLKAYDGKISFDLPQKMIRQVKKSIDSNEFDTFMKLDVADFYPSIRHEELLKRIRGRVRNEIINELILNAIQTPTVSKASAEDKAEIIGVPQGLSISNILAAIYLINIDRALIDRKNIKYFRYVDDILILCGEKDSHEIISDIRSRFRKIGLKIHDPEHDSDKSQIGLLGSKFGYLGYQFESGLVTVRKGSVESLKDSLVSIFTSYKHAKDKNDSFLLWRLDLRITGCLFEAQRKGWLMFFSEITDETLLHNLDLYVSKLVKRFNVSISPKKFVRSFYELKYRSHTTNYIPNFDTYDINQKREFLLKYGFYKEEEINGFSHGKIEYEFRRRIDRQVKDLLTDIQGFSTR